MIPPPSTGLTGFIGGGGAGGSGTAPGAPSLVLRLRKSESDSGMPNLGSAVVCRETILDSSVELWRIFVVHIIAEVCNDLAEDIGMAVKLIYPPMRVPVPEVVEGHDAFRGADLWSLHHEALRNAGALPPGDMRRASVSIPFSMRDLRGTIITTARR